MGRRPVTGARAGVALSGARGATWAGGRPGAFLFDADALAAGDAAALVAPLQAARQAVRQAARPAAGTADGHAVLHVALGGPWSAPRVVALPPMQAREAAVVLGRDHARHFARPRGEPVVAVQRLGAGAWLAADADGIVLAAIRRAATEAGFHAVRIVPAAGAWAAAVGTGRDRTFVADGECTVLGARGGRVQALRRLRAADGPTADPGDDALAVAARFADASQGLELVDGPARAVRDAAARRLARRLVAAGAVMLAAAVAAVPWGAGHRLALVEAERAVLQEAAGPLLARRDSVLAFGASDAALRTLEAHPSWGVRLAALAEALPADAQFTAFRAAGDSAVVTGAAGSVAEALARLREADGVRSVTVLPPADLETVLEVGDPAREPFACVVHFTRPGAP